MSKHYFDSASRYLLRQLIGLYFRVVESGLRLRIMLILAISFLVFWLTILPSELFNEPYSRVIFDKNGEMLAAQLAADEQWRLPPLNRIPEKYQKAVVAFEDKRFYYHPGVDILAMLRALRQNILSRRVVSGGSTITMQTIRLARKNGSRTYFEKIIEILWATRLELKYSKSEILNLYAAHAPFGGNVVGLEAASWRYYGKEAARLSWAEAATLAVLPNSPALIHPGRNRRKLEDKRNALLRKLHKTGEFDKQVLELSIEESLPEKPLPFPNVAPHLLNFAANNPATRNKTYLRTSVDLHLQKAVQNAMKYHRKLWVQNQVHNMAVVVAEVQTGRVVAYVGNALADDVSTEGLQIDLIHAKRSTGSILKPFLYAAMLDDGKILPNALVPDVPANFGGFRPENFHQGYEGAIMANQALTRSLNIPFVYMLQDYGVPKFYHILKKTGMTTLNNSYSHYGLSLILGGCEGTLWEITGMYAAMARVLNNYHPNNGKYTSGDWRPLTIIQGTENQNYSEAQQEISASAVYHTFKAMVELNRPDENNSWRRFEASQPIAWKTGTSYGFRDAWSVGVTPKYAVGVWVGNADGEGRPQLVGVRAAAPLLFDVFRLLEDTSAWFTTPYDEMAEFGICKQSGYLAGPDCPDVEMQLLPLSGSHFHVCPFHKRIHLDYTLQFRVHAGCEAISAMEHRSFFVLPPAMESYYRKKHAEYLSLPPFRDDCEAFTVEEREAMMQVIYPRNLSEIIIPREIDGSLGAAVFEAAHRENDATIFWYIDERYLGATREFHQKAIQATPGKHRLLLVDNSGYSIEMKFSVYETNSEK